MDPKILKKTQDTLGKIIQKPPLTEKLLGKPPFRFLHDVLTSVIKTTGFMQDLFTESEMNSENVKDKDSKIAFLQKSIDMVCAVTGKSLSVKPVKIVAGHEPEKTNELLQALAEAINKNVDNDEYVKRVLKRDSSGTPSKEKEERKDKDRTKSADRRKPKDSEEKQGEKKERDSDHSRDRGDRKHDREDRKQQDKDRDKDRSDKEKEPKTRDSRGGEDRKQRDRDKDRSDKEKEPKTRDSRGDEDRKQQDRDKDRSDKEKEPKTRDSRGERSRKSDRSKEKENESPARVNGDTEDKQEPPPRPQRPASAKGSRRRREEDEEFQKPMSQSEEPTLGEGDLPPQVTAARQLARPSSARPAPPRPKQEATESEPTMRLGTGQPTNLIVDQDDEDEDENFLVGEPAPPPPEPDTTPSKPSDEDDAEHGALVKKMLESKKDLEGGSQNQTRPTKKTEIERPVMSDAQRRKQQEIVQKEVDKLRASIQGLTRSANPLGKVMDYVQEDLDSMQQELERWKAENTQNALDLKREMNVTDRAIEPLRQQLTELDQGIKDQLDKIAATKANIIKNDQKMSKMLRGIASS